MFVFQQEIDPAGHCQVERAHAAGPAQVQLVQPVMRKTFRLQLAHAVPFQVQGQHTPLRLVDAAVLFVGGRLAVFAVVPVHVQHHRHAALQLRWFIQDCGNPQAGQCFVPQLTDAVTRPAFDVVQPFHFRLRIPPGSGLAAEHHLLEGLLPHAGNPLLPRRYGGEFRHRLHASLAEIGHFLIGQVRADDRRPQSFGQRIGLCLPVLLSLGSRNRSLRAGHQQTHARQAQQETQ